MKKEAATGTSVVGGMWMPVGGCCGVILVDGGVCETFRCLFCVVVLGVVFTRFSFHFGVILVPLGVIWRPWAPQGTPKGAESKK